MLQPRPHVLTLSPYQLPDVSSPPGRRKIQLAQNESVFGPSPLAVAAIRDAANSTWLYPDPDYIELSAAIAEVHQVAPAEILFGCGSLELIALLTSAYLQPGERVVTSQYGYLFFRTAAKMAEADIQVAPEPDFRVDVDALLAAVDPSTRIVFLANPGNPTGSLIPKAQITNLRESLSDDVLLIIDEAYADYISPELYEPSFDLAARGNTVILRTFSKIYGMAGMRVGWGICPPDVVDVARRLQTPDTVTRLTQIAATAAMRDQDHVANVREETARIRVWFTDELAALGLDPKPSHTNFVLCDLGTDAAARALSDYLRADGITVRIMHGYGLANHIRITIGTADQMEEVVDLLKAYRT